MNSEANPTNEPDAISDRDLVLNFESIGDNCEFGLVQRMAGAEPPGLLRFANAPARLLARALRARFDGLADPAGVEVWQANGQYTIALRKYELVYHTHIGPGETDPDALRVQQTRTLPFLVEKLIGDLENPCKILVFRQNEPLSANDLIDLRLALGQFGPSTLLWVQQARPSHRAGSVDRVDDTLLAGYVSRLANRENPLDLDLVSWLTMLRRAYALWRARQDGPLNAATLNAPVLGVPTLSTPTLSEPVPSAPARSPMVEIAFGRNGPPRSDGEYGWSPPEADFTWAIDERSRLMVAPPADAPGFRLEMDMLPFVHPPALRSQCLDVMVNGVLVHSFDPVPFGVSTFAVPGELVRGHDQVEILLLHPRAASPKALGAGEDDRRLALRFQRLALFGVTD